ncbi:MAG: hypothetical protein Q4D93_06510 [Porphyromonas sp.]|nr:hypothetical protein [Porphyromonas sp.]
MVGTGNEGLRSAIMLPSLRLGTFDRDSARVAMEQSDETLRVLLFAHKQMVDVDIIKEGYHFTSSSGTNVWQFRITSPSAKTLSFHFDQFELPEGGALFVLDSYRPRETYIGGFGAENNNKNNTLSTELIGSDDVIIEIQSPKGGNTPKIHLSEVNHGVRDLLRASGPVFGGTIQSSYDCTPELACFPEYEQLGRSVVMVVVDGVALGSGVMVNNTSNDGRPLFLTASHVISSNFKSEYRRQYKERAGKVVLYFNYASPTCSGEVRPNTSQTLSGGTLIGVDESVDAILIEMNQRPPMDYKPYYTGWDANKDHIEAGRSYVNVHHPMTLTKRINLYYDKLSVIDYPNSGAYPFGKGNHLSVKAWDIGTTAAGSSGSPIFSNDGSLVGGLSGGLSYCDSKNADFFFSLFRIWEINSEGCKAIVAALDPTVQQGRRCAGKELYESDATRAVRITHIKRSLTNESMLKTYPQMDRSDLLGSNIQASHIGERYILPKGSKVFGLYLILSLPEGLSAVSTLLPPIEVSLFTQENGSERFTLKLPLDGLTENLGKGYDRDEPLLHELYVSLPAPLVIPEGERLIIGVKNSTLPNGISIFHQQHSDTNQAYSSLHYRTGDVWKSATDFRKSASLWIDPVVSEAELGSLDKSKQPLVTISSYDTQQVMLRTAERATSQPLDMEVYTLLGATIYKRTFTEGQRIILLPRSVLEQKGIILIRYRSGEEVQVLKAIFPAI